MPLLFRSGNQRQLLQIGNRPLYIVPVFKSGDASVLDNYRGISLLSVPGKVYSMIIGNRLKAWIDTNLLDVQCGFRPNRGCNDAILA